MRYRTRIASESFAFADLKQVMAMASPPRSGDELAGVAAASAQQRMAARHVLAEVPLPQFLSEALIPYESDNITRLIIDGHDAAAFAPVAHLTVGGFRDWLLSEPASTDVTKRASFTSTDRLMKVSVLSTMEEPGASSSWITSVNKVAGSLVAS